MAGLAALLAACAQQPSLPGADEPAPQATACPPELPATVKCLAGKDKAGAFYLIAMPQDWNGHLVLHAHGGPFLGDPTARRIEDDLKRWAIVPRSGGQPVFGNTDALYQGHPYAVALNAAVPRYAPDPKALARFSEDTDPTGRIPVPVLTVHGIHDPTAFVEMQHTFAQTMAAAGRADSLVQTFTNEHSYLSDATYVALLDALRSRPAPSPRRRRWPKAAPRPGRHSRPSAASCRTTGRHRWTRGWRRGGAVESEALGSGPSALCSDRAGKHAECV
jgi:hypothetical protein